MMNNDLRFTGTKLRDVLYEQGRRQDWLAEKIGVSPAAVNRWVNGTRSMDLASAKRISDVLGVPFYLIFDVPVGTEKFPSLEAA